MLELLSRADAQSRGLANYFTGKPCSRGHVAERNVKGKHCNVCVREANVQMRERLGEDAWLVKERARWLDYNRRNPEKRRASAKIIMARLYKVDPQRFIKRAAAEKQRMLAIDPKAVRLSEAARRAAHAVRKAGNHSERGLTAVVRRVWGAAGGACGVCKARGALELDHVVAVVNGGTNDETNLQFLCQPCNRSKGAKDFKTWLQSRAEPEGMAA